MVNTYKVVLCGKTGVGKTSIFNCVCGLPLDSTCKQHAGKTIKDHERLVTVNVEDKTVEVHTILFKLYIIINMSIHASILLCDLFFFLTSHKYSMLIDTTYLSNL